MRALEVQVVVGGDYVIPLNKSPAAMFSEKLVFVADPGLRVSPDPCTK